MLAKSTVKSSSFEALYDEKHLFEAKNLWSFISGVDTVGRLQ